MNEILWHLYVNQSHRFVIVLLIYTFFLVLGVFLFIFSIVLGRLLRLFFNLRDGNIKLNQVCNQMDTWTLNRMLLKKSSVWQLVLTHLFVQIYIHAESEHALYPVSISLGVTQLVAGPQCGRLEQNHSQIGRSLVLSVILQNVRGGGTFGHPIVPYYVQN